MCNPQRVKTHSLRTTVLAPQVPSFPHCDTSLCPSKILAIIPFLLCPPSLKASKNCPCSRSHPSSARPQCALPSKSCTSLNFTWAKTLQESNLPTVLVIIQVGSVSAFTGLHRRVRQAQNEEACQLLQLLLDTSGHFSSLFLFQNASSEVLLPSFCLSQNLSLCPLTKICLATQDNDNFLNQNCSFYLVL